MMKHSLFIIGTAVLSLSLATAANAQCGTYYSCQDDVDHFIVDMDEYRDEQSESIRESVNAWENNWQ